MKIPLFINLILNLILITSLKTFFSQANLNSFQKEELMPIPSWVKEGVCLVYKIELGSHVGIGVESSAVALMGYSICIVTRV